MTKFLRRSIAIASLLIAVSGVSAYRASAQESDSSVFARLTSIDPELLQYFPRWYVCEPDLQAKIFNAFRVLGYRRDNLNQQQVVVTAQPISNEEDPYEILIVECGSERMTAQEMSSNIPNIMTKLSERRRAYCYTEIPATRPPTQPQTEAIISFMRPTNVNHSFTLSAFEQTLKVGKSGFWLSNMMGTDQVGYHFWNAGEGKILLQRPLYENEDVSTRRAIQYLINARLGFGYRLSSDPTTSSILDFIPSRRLDAGYGGKFVGGLDFHMPFHPEFGASVNVELPLRSIDATQGVDAKTYALTDIGNRNVTAPFYESDPIATVNLLRSTGQVTFFYNWWLDPKFPENFFRFDIGINYFEVREAGMFRDTALQINYMGIDGVRGLRTWKPNEAGDWIYAKLEYRSQNAFPFGASLQYANQILLAHAYVPLLGQWLYIEGKYAQPLRGLRPFEREHVFMISPVLRLNF
jgi:hypothetical protein